MKNLLFLAIILGSLSLNAQPGPAYKHKKEPNHKELLKELTPQQRAEVLSKRMVLQLDLDDKQQKQVASLLLERESNRPLERPDRETIKDMSAEQRFDLMNNKLDEKIDFNRSLKTILTEAQWTKWKEGQERKNKGRKRAHAAIKR